MPSTAFRRGERTRESGAMVTMRTAPLRQGDEGFQPSVVGLPARLHGSIAVST